MNSLCYLLLLLFAAACQNNSESLIEIRMDHTVVFSGQAMTMQYKIIIGQSLDTHQIDAINHIVKATFAEVNSIYNKWNPASELSALNRLKVGVKFPISPELERLIRETDLIVKLSGGRFDPTIEPLERLWLQRLSQGAIPSDEELAEIAPAIGWDKIHIGDGVFYKDHDLTALDLGGIAKGLAIDLILERLNHQGYTQLFIEWGGEIRAQGQHPTKRPWTIFISRLENSDPLQAIATLSLEDQAIATSGDYQQNWSHQLKEEDGKRKTITYFHIFDPHTLRPLEATHASIASASVVAPTCAFADGLATAAMLFPTLSSAEEWAQQIKSEFPNVSFLLISRCMKQ